MIVYRDMTFCSDKDCANTKCKRNLKNIDLTKVPSDMGIAMSDFYVCCLQRVPLENGEAQRE